MWLQCRSRDSDCGHMIGDLGLIRSCDWEESDATSPWILALDTSSKSQSQNQNGQQCQPQFFQVFITNITGLCCNYVPKSVPKLNLRINAHNIQARMLYSEYI